MKVGEKTESRDPSSVINTCVEAPAQDFSLVPGRAATRPADAAWLQGLGPCRERQNVRSSRYEVICRRPEVTLGCIGPPIGTLAVILG